MEITFLDKETFPFYTHFLRPDLPHLAYEWCEYPFTSPREVVDRAKNSDILIVNKVRLDAAVLEQLPKLKFISLTATGYDNVDIDYCNRNGISVSNVKNYGTASVVEHTFTLIFALMRNLARFRETVLQGNWEKANYFSIFPGKITELAQKTMGIVGPGVLGQQVAKIATALGMKVYFLGKEGKSYPDLAHPCLTLPQLLPVVDVLSLHLPLTPESRDLITLKEIQQMKKSSLIINTARGGIVNEEDLKQALLGDLIGGAGIDVLSQEPPTAGNPLLSIKNHPHLIITPHVAWGGIASVNNLMKKTIENIENFLKGEPTSLVTKNN